MTDQEVSVTLFDEIHRLRATLAAEQSSRQMFVARLKNMQSNNDSWLTIESIIELLNDCDMLANYEVDKPRRPRKSPGTL